MFSLSTANGGATPYGTFGISINDTAGSGSGNAYYGDLEFNVTRTSGLSTDDFITNSAIDPGSSGPAYFAADLTDGGTNTGSQAWLSRNTTYVPEPASLTIFGTAFGALALARRRRLCEAVTAGRKKYYPTGWGCTRFAASHIPYPVSLCWAV